MQNLNSVLIRYSWLGRNVRVYKRNAELSYKCISYTLEAMQLEHLIIPNQHLDVDGF